MKNTKFSDIFKEVRQKHPLVHHITNYVTVNDCANITIATGAAPVMADAEEEVCEMVAVSGALVLNIGTLNAGQVASMILAGGMANDLGIPVILDPVGAGATRFRTSTALRLLDELKVTILKGNQGEIGLAEGTKKGLFTLNGRSVPLVYADPIGSDPLLADLMVKNAIKALTLL
jgi:hydroxyethylthiazole kinase